MTAMQVDLTIEQGATFSHGWRFTFDGTPLDNTWTAAAQIRKRRDHDAPLLYTFTTAVDETGAVVLAVPAADSEAWDWDMGYYDLEVTNGAGNVTLRAVQGMVRVSREVTRG